MKITYSFFKHSQNEREFYEMVLLEELDMQRWYSVTYNSILAEEQFLNLQ